VAQLKFSWKAKLADHWRDISALGSSSFYFSLIAAAALLGVKIVALRLLVGYFLIEIVVWLVRLVHYKERPDKEKFTAWWQKVNTGSFPSAHAARAAFTMMVLSWHFQSLYLSLFLAVLSVFVMQARVYLKRHDDWDVFAGQLLGVALTLLA